jgi:hypothetical protein
MLEIFKSAEVYSLKELEKLGVKKGVLSQSIPDIVKGLVDEGLVDMDKIGGGNLYVQSRVAKCTRARIFESPPYRPPDSSMCVTEQLLGFAEQAGAAQKGKAGTAPGRFNGRARRRGPRAHQDGAARRGEAGNRRTGNQSQETGRAQTAAGWRENCLLVLFSILYTSVYPPAKGRVIVEDSEKGEYRSQQVYSVS